MDDGEPRDALRRALGWSAHPVTIAGLVLLLVNDHVLKAWQPGPVTGKLSDVAGMLMFPPLLAVVAALAVPRLPGRALAVGALAATGAGFALVKSTGYGAQLASQAWSLAHGPSVVRADPTDLLALPALALCWWAWRRTVSRPPVGRGVARLVRGAVLAPVALLATMATSAPQWPETVLVVEAGDKVLIGVDDRSGSGDERTDADGGWSDLGQPESVDSWTRLRWAESVDDGQVWVDFYATPPTMTPPWEDCAALTCYRIVPDELHVQTSDDGGRTWRTAWEVKGRQLEALREEYEDEGVLGLLGTPAGDLSSHAVVVREVAGGHVVLVANGRDGLLRRDPGGSWTRLGSWTGGHFEPPPPLPREPRPGDRLRTGLHTAAGVFLFVLVAGAVTATAGRRVLPLPVLALSGVAALLFVGASALAGALLESTAMLVAALALGAVTSSLLALLAVRLRRAGLLRTPRVLSVLGLAVVAAAGADLARADLARGVPGEPAFAEFVALGTVFLFALVGGGVAAWVVHARPLRAASRAER